MTTHPPLLPGEKFLGNTTSKKLPEYLKSVKGIIFARPAYDIDGKKLSGHYAMIAETPEAAEQYNRIMEARLSQIRSGMNS